MTEHVSFDPERLRRRIAARQRLAVSLDGFFPAAVLVPIVTEPGQPDRLLFTERRHDLSTHAGQIAFPGGKQDPEDVDAAATAIRETTEELGIEPAAIEVLGTLDDVPTPTRFVITPIVARIRGPLVMRPNPAEVASVFAADLGSLADPGRYTSNGARSFLGVTYEMHEYRWETHRIWGATARMVHQVMALLDSE
ncbi:MAG: Hydrolase, family [Myxococcales bacterium]|nr:Hydrolase, family [Myxococcales bacterium]